MIQTAMRNALYGSNLFFLARDTYERLFRPERFSARAKMQAFYQQFVNRGDVVFDIGANIGEYSQVFSGLGATVVAVEPNPACCQSLYRLANMRNVKVESCAVGEKSGMAKFTLCNEAAFSTLNPQWLDKTKASPAHRNVKWLDPIDVPVTTLDILAQQHGNPSFIKIDVEGNEEMVLAGMSFRPSCISFEFNVLALDVATRCLQKLEGYEFNLILGREFEFASPKWMAESATSELLASIAGKTEYGDIFARRAD